MEELRRMADLQTPERQAMSDVVFDVLYRQILSLDLPPNTKMSEAEVAKLMGVSRQPVRDAFHRLSRLGFLDIRPQRATVVSPISIQAVAQARFIRKALEMETVRTACERLGSEEIALLEDIVERQRDAVSRSNVLEFYELDDDFHWEICRLAGLEFAWEVIRENKAHMDRVRCLSLTFASEEALEDHVSILTAIKLKQSDKAAEAMGLHLSRIRLQLSRIHDEHKDYFSGDRDFEL
ncbi:GntR family transcriptional regulator [Roseibium sediminis]|uniref:GntR family transcriptional regulator n=1 Tax=Roseibium sediminis TaxID=1775174 RepID=UPI00123E0FB0|nr:GntR family transcriptional regulator [Roseibium sediminis]